MASSSIPKNLSVSIRAAVGAQKPTHPGSLIPLSPEASSSALFQSHAVPPRAPHEAPPLATLLDIFKSELGHTHAYPVEALKKAFLEVKTAYQDGQNLAELKTLMNQKKDELTEVRKLNSTPFSDHSFRPQSAQSGAGIAAAQTSLFLKFPLNINDFFTLLTPSNIRSLLLPPELVKKGWNWLHACARDGSKADLEVLLGCATPEEIAKAFHQETNSGLLDPDSNCKPMKLTRKNTKMNQGEFLELLFKKSHFCILFFYFHEKFNRDFGLNASNEPKIKEFLEYVRFAGLYPKRLASFQFSDLKGDQGGEYDMLRQALHFHLTRSQAQEPLSAHREDFPNLPLVSIHKINQQLGVLFKVAKELKDLFSKDQPDDILYRSITQICRLTFYYQTGNIEHEKKRGPREQVVKILEKFYSKEKLWPTDLHYLGGLKRGEITGAHCKKAGENFQSRDNILFVLRENKIPMDFFALFAEKMDPCELAMLAQNVPSEFQCHQTMRGNHGTQTNTTGTYYRAIAQKTHLWLAFAYFMRKSLTQKEGVWSQTVKYRFEFFLNYVKMLAKQEPKAKQFVEDFNVKIAHSLNPLAFDGERASEFYLILKSTDETLFRLNDKNGVASLQKIKEFRQGLICLFNRENLPGLDFTASRIVKDALILPLLKSLGGVPHDAGEASSHQSIQGVATYDAPLPISPPILPNEWTSNEFVSRNIKNEDLS